MSDWNLDRYATDVDWRRVLVLGLTALTTMVGVLLMAEILGPGGISLIEIGVLAAFTPGFAMVSLSFWAALAGFILSLLGLHPVTLRRAAPSAGVVPALGSRTAILMPIYNEDSEAVMARLAATYESVRGTGQLDSFGFHVLSDTTDAGLARLEEERFEELRRRYDAEGRMFYRRRPKNIGRKAGNIADWLRADGRRYDHMIILDADSVMSGDTIVRLAVLMERNPRTGLIQTHTASVGRETLFARLMQFSGRLYGPLLAAGHSFWQAGEANYYGHNAIIRVAAFAEHCHLPVLPGKPPLGGEILSHDFVEAALLRRAGWRAWLLPELGGSFEEMPTNLLDYAARDRRWVQGNLQHARLLAMPGLHWMSRLHLAMGVLAYVASPLWLTMLLLTGVLVLDQAVTGHVYFDEHRSLFPLWPEYKPGEIQSLLTITASLLFLPRVMAMILALARGTTARRFGGRMALAISGALELVFSMLLAPVMMLFHSAFIAAILSGRPVGWPPQPREERRVRWAAALDRHLPHMLGGTVATGLILTIAPEFLIWIAPVCAGLLLAVPLNVLSSCQRCGRVARAGGLFLIPEEVRVPRELDFANRQGFFGGVGLSAAS
ncbi:MAG: glucans biosynthesis glucosyltransferase MdoH [Alphaproteobacteria bacterium]|nr:glucans biosynthesis glucosyltransferase MdoH [Alphaproteobacteria bacterium]MCW5741514.1 glucans biosynthesis glucosyltransferase MdoH [Alphaproteobacteria bacterium]